MSCTPKDIYKELLIQKDESKVNNCRIAEAIDKRLKSRRGCYYCFKYFNNLCGEYLFKELYLTFNDNKEFAQKFMIKKFPSILLEEGKK